MKILVTGASGFIGKQLCDYIQRNTSHRTELFFLERAEKKTKNKKNTFYFNDDYTDIVINTNISFNYLIHLAYDAENITNNEKMAYILSHLYKKGVVKNIILTSSIDVYGTDQRGCVALYEKKPKPTKCYGKTKQKVEEIFFKEISKESLCVLRIGIILGVESWWSNFLSKSKNWRNIELPNGGSNITNYIELQDLLEIIFSLIVSFPLSNNRIFNIGNPIPWIELYRKFNTDIKPVNYKDDTIKPMTKLKIIFISSCIIYNLMQKMKIMIRKYRKIQKNNQKEILSQPNNKKIYKPLEDFSVYHAHISSINFKCKE